MPHTKVSSKWIKDEGKGRQVASANWAWRWHFWVCYQEDRQPKHKGAADLQQTKALPHSRRKSLKAKGNVKNSWYFQLQYLMIKKLILSRTKSQRGGGRGHKVPPQVSSYWWLLPARRDRVCPRGVAPGRSNTLQWTDTLKNRQAILKFFFSLNEDTSWLSMKWGSISWER